MKDQFSKENIIITIVIINFSLLLFLAVVSFLCLFFNKKKSIKRKSKIIMWALKKQKNSIRLLQKILLNIKNTIDNLLSELLNKLKLFSLSYDYIINNK
tara:strand:+ start:379 stop:675 length:297 start_codon:yes stop_codon:yes gene_type:complete